MSDITGIEGPGPEFERIGVENGGFWYARQLMELLGYENNYIAFQKPIGRSIGTFTTLEIPIAEGFTQVEREIDGANVADYKLTRFACYLIAMNGDPAKEQVAATQLYFASIAKPFDKYTAPQIT
jgi:DNA-damage-inducible protein D